MSDELKSSILPSFLYGTAWKEEKTESITFQALKAGFTGVDTANQRKHYFEEGVGLGIQRFLKESGKKRAELFLQTKFTSAPGQDDRKPYEDSDEPHIQVKKSFNSSLIHLQTDYIDSYVLHGPTFSSGLSQFDLAYWSAMEELFREGKIRWLGISNVKLEQLEMLYKIATIKPTFVQNRCFAIGFWDKAIREFCQEHAIIYQGFSLLTANWNFILSGFIKTLAQCYGKTPAQIIFRFALQKGMLPLTGTTNEQHMRQDLEALSFALSSEELENIEAIATL